ncbi:MAG TPA: hypothetical protein ENI51_06215 [Candidatus Atribacteria bacterium]|nr:hypothetical protein [Candidatus Atribacteria bacterium]
MKLKVLVATLKTDKRVEEDTSKFRGYIGGKFPEYILLHHHVNETENLYAYPKIQYKILEGTPVIVGIEEGTDILKRISDDLNELKLGKSKYKIESIQMNQFNADFGKCRENIKYRFLTPWLALNPENYKRYSETKNWKEKKELLNSILVGNILSMCKSLNYMVLGKLYAHSLLDRMKVSYKAIPHVGFIGEFRINFKIPNFIGLGKGVSHGFGTVKKVENDREKTQKRSNFGIRIQNKM